MVPWVLCRAPVIVHSKPALSLRLALARSVSFITRPSSKETLAFADSLKLVPRPEPGPEVLRSPEVISFTVPPQKDSKVKDGEIQDNYGLLRHCWEYECSSSDSNLIQV